MEESGQYKYEVVGVLDQWRQAMGLNHRQFVESYLSRDESEWSMYRAGSRYPTATFLRAARSKAREAGGVWLRPIDEAVKADALARVA